MNLLIPIFVGLVIFAGLVALLAFALALSRQYRPRRYLVRMPLEVLLKQAEEQNRMLEREEEIREDEFLFAIEDIFEDNLGLVIASAPNVKVDLPEGNCPVALKKPDGTIIEDHASKTTEKVTTNIPNTTALLLMRLTKRDVPKGTEVWRPGRGPIGDVVRRQREEALRKYNP